MALNFKTDQLILTKQVVRASGNSLYVNGIEVTAGVSGNLIQTGAQLGNTIVQTGNAAVAHANGIGVIISGNLTQTGATLQGRINSLSGWTAPAAANYVYTSGNQSVTGTKTFIAEIVGTGMNSQLGNLRNFVVSFGEGSNGTTNLELFTNNIQNLLANYDYQGGTVAVAVESGLGITNPLNTIRYGSSEAIATLAITGNTGQLFYTFNGINHGSFSNGSNWYIYLKNRSSSFPASVKFEVLADGSGAYSTLYNGPTNFNQGVFLYGPFQVPTPYSITGCRYSLSYTTLNATGYLREVGLIHANQPPGKNAFATWNTPNYFDSVQVILNSTETTSQANGAFVVSGGGSFVKSLRFGGELISGTTNIVNLLYPRSNPSGFITGLAGTGNLATVVQLNALSGYTNAQDAATGSAAVNHANGIGTILSGNLTLTGSALFVRDGTISGVLQTYIDAISAGTGAIANNVVYTTGTQFISGSKYFIGNTYMDNLFVTGSQIVVNTQDVCVGDNWLVLNATGGARDSAIWISTGITGASATGAIIGFDVPSNTWVFGMGGYMTDLVTLPKIASLTDIANASGGLEARITQTGNAAVAFANGMGTIISGNLTQTGATLQGRITSLSGFVGNVSGGLEARITATGNAAITHANGMGTILSGNLTQTGATLQGRIASLSGFVGNVSGGLEIRIAQTGAAALSAAQTYANGMGSIISGNLTLTGQTLRALTIGGDTNLSGNINGLSGVMQGTFVHRTGNEQISGYKIFLEPSGMYVEALRDSSLATSVSVAGRQLNDNTDQVSLSWAARTLHSSPEGYQVLNWDTSVLKSDGNLEVISLDWFNRTLYGIWTGNSWNNTSGSLVNYFRLSGVSGALQSQISAPLDTIVYKTGTQSITGNKSFLGNTSFQSGLYETSSTVSASYTVKNSDSRIYCDNTSLITLLVGSAVTNSGQMVKVKLINTGWAILTGTAGQTFDGSPSYVLNGQYNTYQIHSNGANWYLW